MRLTLREFNRLYQCYKDDWDMEMIMNASHTTYQKLKEKQIKDEHWF